MRKVLAGLTIVGASFGMLIPASPAGATTCEIGDPGVEDVVCVIVGDPMHRRGEGQGRLLPVVRIRSGA
jgi:hypothetical protein